MPLRVRNIVDDVEMFNRNDDTTSQLVSSSQGLLIELQDVTNCTITLHIYTYI